MRSVFLQVWTEGPNVALALVAGWSPHDKTNNMLSCEMAFDLISEVRRLANFPTRLDRNRNGK